MVQQLSNNSGSVSALLKAPEVAVLLGLSTKTIHKLVREKKLACVQVTARDRRFTPEQVQEYIRSQSTEVRVDRRAAPAVTSRPKKGGDRAKSSGVLSRQALLEEMRKCQ